LKGGGETALAVLEIIQGSDYAYYTYGAWGDDEAALMSNGSGDEYSIVFTDTGVFIRVFDHESQMTPYANDDHALWPRLLDGLPPFPPSQGPYDTSPDGADRLAILCDDIVDRYVDFASDYEIEVDRAAVAHIVAMRPLTDAVVRALNPDVNLTAIDDPVASTGYPINRDT
jgi:hypothetical protein